MENKICVYAICKNEEQFVDRWYESVKEADYICVLDTGSTDNTVEKLKEHGIRVEQKIINPWRFDVARNESLKLVPEDCNILICLDLDEVLEAGWAEKVKKAWVPGITRLQHEFVWSHTDSGAELRTYIANRIHDKSWTWKYPVHEILYKDNASDSEFAYVEGVRVHHYPAPKESRSSYLGLLEVRVKEDPEDWLGKLYLGHELNFSGRYEDSIVQLTDILMNHSEHYSAIERSNCYLFLGEDYYNLGDKVKAIQCYLLSIEEEPTLREGYLGIARIYLEQEKYDLAISYVKEGLRMGVRHYYWLERDTSWSYSPWEILTRASYYSGNKRDSIAYAYKALQFDKESKWLQENLRICLEQTSLEDLIK